MGCNKDNMNKPSFKSLYDMVEYAMKIRKLKPCALQRKLKTDSGWLKGILVTFVNMYVGSHAGAVGMPAQVIWWDKYQRLLAKTETKL
jgi:hypothetical protein